MTSAILSMSMTRGNQSQIKTHGIVRQSNIQHQLIIEKDLELKASAGGIQLMRSILKIIKKSFLNMATMAKDSKQATITQNTSQQIQNSTQKISFMAQRSTLLSGITCGTSTSKLIVA